MSIEELKKDAAAAHAVFDLCNILKINRGTTPLSLRMRASMLAKLAGVKPTQGEVGMTSSIAKLGHYSLSKKMKTKQMTTLQLRNSIGWLAWRSGVLLIALALVWFALSPTAQAVTPAPDGGYPNQNTAEGDSALFSLTTGGENTATGFQALFSNTTGGKNTATGFQALLSNTTGFNNTATGFEALFSNTTGDHNTANGVAALFSNTAGFFNTATGAGALQDNTTGDGNTANGVSALSNNRTGSNNTANGVQALAINRTGNNNTANGTNALFSNTTGGNNTAIGTEALFNNAASNNTANGVDALFSNTTGGSNTASGAHALQGNTTGFRNTANGNNALLLNETGNGNTAEGAGALGSNTGSFNTAVGFNAGASLTTGSNNIDIGPPGVAGEANTIRIGAAGKQTAAFIAGIHGVAVTGTPVVVSGSGQLGVAPSSERFKNQIKPMDKASEAILQLQPVTFRYKKELDPDGIPQFGLIAEQVEKVNPDLVVRDADGKINTVRNEAVNAMLLNEFLKEHGKVEQQATTIAQQRKDFQASITKLEATVAQQQKDFQATAARQQEQIEALTSGLQKVSAQVEMSRPAPQMVLNNH